MSHDQDGAAVNLKVGDMIWLAFMRFGKWPCATREEALKRLRELIEGKIDEAVTEVDSWRQKLAEVDAQIAGEVP
jgi:hypothetical protein